MYGTAMVGKARGDANEVVQALMDWHAERAPKIDGFVSAGVVVSPDGRVVNYAEFESRDAYEKLGQDAEQDKWWRERMAPLLDGEPEWIDGDWAVAMPPARSGPSGRKMIDCRQMPSESNCSLMISGTEDEVVRAAMAHAADIHGHQPTPELERMLRSGLQDA